MPLHSEWHQHCLSKKRGDVDGSANCERRFRGKSRDSLDDSTDDSDRVSEGYRTESPLNSTLFARSAPEVLQFRLPLFGFLALRLADEKSAAAHVLCFVKLVFCQWFRSADDESKFHCNALLLPLKTAWDYFSRCFRV